MLKTLIVDDEKLVRQVIMRCIKWEELGFEIIGEASSGRMGLELAEELKPDLVMLDIKMPGMSGLVCSRKLIEKYPWIKVIILSGHDEFEYATEGIRLGVSDYLLKPVNPEELKAAVLKVKDVILNERNHQKEFVRLKEELKKHSGYIRDRQLAAMVTSSDPAQYMDSLEYLGVNFKPGVYQAAALELDPGPGRTFSSEEKFLIKLRAIELTADCFDNIEGIYAFDGGAASIVLLNNAGKDTIYDHADELKAYLENNTGAAISVGVGNAYDSPGKLRMSYQEAVDALKYASVSGEGDTVFYRDIYAYYDTDIEYSINEDNIHEFGNAVRIGNAAEAEKLLDPMLESLKRSMLTDRGRYSSLFTTMRISSEIMKALSELRADRHDIVIDNNAEIEKMLKLSNYEDVKNYLKSASLNACRITSGEIADKEKSLTHKVRDYIMLNYADEDLSLNGVAGIYYVNSSYLSRVFKEKTGVAFSAYLLEVRMEEAKRLLLHTDSKSYEIAEKVGIPDPHYFSACFKKYTGMSVSEYRKKNR